MIFGGMNYLAIVIAAIAGFGFGAIYYMSLARAWMNAQGWSPEEQAQHMRGELNPSKMPFVVAILANLLMAWVLAGVIGHLGPGQVTIRNGLISAGFCWLGFIVTTMSVNNAFGARKPALTFIDAGHWLGVLLIMGAVIGAFGV